MEMPEAPHPRIVLLDTKVMAISHILSLVLRTLETVEPGIIEKVSETVDPEIRRLFGGGECEELDEFAHDFRAQALSILGTPSLRKKFDEGAPIPP